MNDAKSRGHVPLLIIVRRGAMERFQFLEEEFADVAVRIVWDRRGGERRRRQMPTDERRHGDRRGRPAASWSTLDFVVVREPGS